MCSPPDDRSSIQIGIDIGSRGSMDHFYPLAGVIETGAQYGVHLGGGIAGLIRICSRRKRGCNYKHGLQRPRAQIKLKI